MHVNHGPLQIELNLDGPTRPANHFAPFGSLNPFTMYLPPQFKAKDAAHAARLMRDYPLAALISNDDAGFPFVSHIPLHLSDAAEPWRLLGHVAKANPHWRYLAARPQALVTFMGPQA